jgi:adenosine deaminase
MSDYRCASIANVSQGASLIGQYDILRGVHGLDDQALADLASQSVRASTAPAEVTKRLLADIARWIGEP